MKKSLFLISLLTILLASGSIRSQDWITLPNSPVDNSFVGHNDLWFININTGWVVGGYGIRKTTDGGNSWVHVLNATQIKSVRFADSLNGWATAWGFGVNPSLYKTTDGGLVWTGITNIPAPGVQGLTGLSVLSANDIIAIGYDEGTPRSVRSTNAGANWSCVNLSAYATQLTDCHFFDKDSGVAAGYQFGKGVILGTADGGTTWSVRHVSTASTNGAGKMSFVNNTGYATFKTITDSSQSFFLKTTNKGLNWTQIIYPPIPNYMYDIVGIGFLTSKIGWVGKYNSTFIFGTSDGGGSWNPVNFGSKINRLRFINDSIGYAAGVRIYQYTRTFLLSGDPIIQALPTDHRLEQNYPNPFNPSTMINYQLPISNNVRLNIYNVNGRLVKVLVNEMQKAGTHSITFDGAGMPSGVYFYKLEAGEYRETRKMLLIK